MCFLAKGESLSDAITFDQKLKWELTTKTPSKLHNKGNMTTFSRKIMDTVMTERDGIQLRGSTWTSEGREVIGKGAQSM